MERGDVVDVTKMTDKEKVESAAADVAAES